MALTQTQIKNYQQGIDAINAQNQMNQTKAFVQQHTTTPLRPTQRYADEDYVVADMIKNRHVYKNAFERVAALTYDELGIDPEFVNSRFDKRITSLSDAQNVNAFRASEQSGFGKILNGVGQAAVRFGTTAVESANLLGLGAAIFGGQMLFANPDQRAQLRQENQYFWINNEFTRTLAQINDWAQQAIPIYRTDEDRNDTNLFHNFGSAGWWGENVISNFGFTLGAMVGGKGIGKLTDTALTKAFAKSLSKLAGVEGMEAVEQFIAQNHNSTSEAIQQTIKQLNKRLYAKSFASTAVGITTASMGESNIEAVENYRNFLNEHKQHLQQYWNPQSAEAQYAYQLAIRNGETNLSLSDYCQQKYQENVHMADQYANQILRKTFWLETALLTATNAVAFKNWFDVSFNHSKMLWNKVKPWLDVTTDAKTKLPTDVKFNRGVGTVVKNTLGYLKPFISEGFEEMGQAGISEGLRQYYGSRLNKDYRNENLNINPAYMNRTLNVVEGILEGAKWTFSPSALQEGFVGGFTGLIGLPARTMSRAQRKANNLNAFDRKTWQMQGGFWDTYRQIRDEKALAKNVVTEMQKIINSDTNIHDLIRTMNILSSQSDVQKIATIIGDKKAFLDGQQQTFMALLNMYEQLGMGTEFEEMFDTVINAEQNADEKAKLLDLIKNYYEHNITTSDKQSNATKELSDAEVEEIFQSVVKHAKQNKKRIADYRQLSKQVGNLLAQHVDINDKKNRSYVELVVNTLWRVQDLERRQKEIADDPVLKTIFNEFQKQSQTILQQRQQINMDPQLSETEKQERLQKLSSLRLSDYLENKLPILANYEDKFDSFDEIIVNQFQVLDATYKYLSDTVSSIETTTETNNPTSTTVAIAKAANKLRDWYLNDKEIYQLSKRAVDMLNGIISPEQVQKSQDNYINRINNIEYDKKLQSLIDDIEKIQMDSLTSLENEAYTNLMKQFDERFYDLFVNRETQHWNQLCAKVFAKDENKKHTNPKLLFFYNHFIAQKQIKTALNAASTLFTQKLNQSKLDKINSLKQVDINDLSTFLKQQIINSANSQKDLQDWKDLASILQPYIDKLQLNLKQIQSYLKKVANTSSTTIENTKSNEVLEDVDYEVPTSIVNTDVPMDNSTKEQIDAIATQLTQTCQAFEDIPESMKTELSFQYNNGVFTIKYVYSTYNLTKMAKYDLYNNVWSLQVINTSTNEQINLNMGKLTDVINSGQGVLEKLDTLIEQQLNGSDLFEQPLLWQLGLMLNYDWAISHSKKSPRPSTNIFMPFVDSRAIVNKNSDQYSATIGPFLLNPNNSLNETREKLVKECEQLMAVLKQPQSHNTVSQPISIQPHHINGLKYPYTQSAIDALKKFKDQFPIGRQMNLASIRTALMSMKYLNDVTTFNSADDLQAWAKELGYWITFSDKDNAVIDNITFYEGQDGQPYTLTTLSNLKHMFEIGETFNIQTKEGLNIPFTITSLINQTRQIALAESNNKEYVIQNNATSGRLYLKKNVTRTSQHNVTNSEMKRAQSIVGISQYDTRVYSDVETIGANGQPQRTFDANPNQYATRTMTQASSKWQRNPIFYQALQNLFNSAEAINSPFSIYEYYGTGQFKQDFERNPKRPVCFRLKPINEAWNVAKMYTLNKHNMKKFGNNLNFIIECYWENIPGQQQVLGYLDPIDNAQLVDSVLSKISIGEMVSKYTTVFENTMLDAYESIIYCSTNKTENLTQPLNQAYQTTDDGYTATNGKQPQIILKVGDRIYSNVEWDDQQMHILYEHPNIQPGKLYLIPYDSSNNTEAKKVIPIELVIQSFRDLTETAKNELFGFLNQLGDANNYTDKDLFEKMCETVGVNLAHTLYTTTGHTATKDAGKLTLDDYRFVIHGDYTQNTIEIALRYKTEDGKYHDVLGQNEQYLSQYRLELNTNQLKPQEIQQKVYDWLSSINPLIQVDKSIFENPKETAVRTRPDGPISLKGLIANGCLNTPTKHIYKSNATAQLALPVQQPAPKISAKEAIAKEGSQPQGRPAKSPKKSTFQKPRKNNRDLLSQAIVQQPTRTQGILLVDNHSYQLLHQFKIGENTLTSFIKNNEICFVVNTNSLRVVKKDYLPLLGQAIQFYKTNNTLPINLSQLYAPKTNRKTKKVEIIAYMNTQTQSVLQDAQWFANDLNVAFTTDNESETATTNNTTLEAQTLNFPVSNESKTPIAEPLVETPTTTPVIAESVQPTPTPESFKEEPVEPATEEQKQEFIKDIIKLLTDSSDWTYIWPDGENNPLMAENSKTWTIPFYDINNDMDSNITFQSIVDSLNQSKTTQAVEKLKGVGFNITEDLLTAFNHYVDPKQTNDTACQ